MGEVEGKPPHARLTPREREMACLAAQGLSLDEIAQMLYVAQTYVKRTLSQRVYRKFEDAFFPEGRRVVNQAMLAFLLRPYVDWVAQGRPRIQ